MREMKDSGISWIGQIPADWSIVKIKAGVHKVGSGKTPSGGATTYADEGILFLRSQNVYDTGLELSNPTYITPEVDEEMKGTRVFPNDVLLNITGGSIGRCCIFPESLKTANVNQHVSIIRVNQDVFLPEYMHYYWVSPLGSLAIDLYQTGGNREGMSADAIKNTPIILIPLDEQRRICRVLDNECSKIDSVLAKIRTSIEEYKKLKQAIITQAVTKGVRGDRPMKESGIEWVPMIPADWELCRLRNLGDVQNGISKGGDAFGSGYPFVSYGDVYKNIELPFEVKGLIESSDEERERYSVKAGDIFFTRTSETIDEVGFSSACLQTIPNATFAGFLIRVRPFNDKLSVRFSKYYFRSGHHRMYFAKEMNLVTRASLGQNLLKNLPVLVPPKSEQLFISDYLDNRCGQIDRQIEKEKRLLLELESYKKSLIYEYVTGKKEAL